MNPRRLRPGLLNLTDRIKHLPRDHRGYPIPWFVYRDALGQPDFRVVGPGKIEAAARYNLCWVCGTRLSRRKTFVIGPVGIINRISAEPPMHRSCALFAATNCPFITKPRMRRNATDLPDEAFSLEGAIAQNPGVVAVWQAYGYRMFMYDRGWLFEMGEPDAVQWYTQGRPATRREVFEAIERGLPPLIEAAMRESADALQALMVQISKAQRLLPPRRDDHVGHGQDQRPPARGDERDGGTPHAQ